MEDVIMEDIFYPKLTDNMDVMTAILSFLNRKIKFNDPVLRLGGKYGW